MGDELHLRAEDAEDLAVLSSCLQDALVPLIDMRYEPAARRFVLAVNRFRWETGTPSQGADRPAHAFERIACGVAFEGVRQVRLQGIDRSKRGQLLELLAVLTGADAAARAASVMPGLGATTAPVTIFLVFAAGGAIRLEADGIRARLDDFGAPWPTQFVPRHGLDTL